MKRALVLVGMVLSCGPGIREKSDLRVTSTDEFVDAVARRDVEGIASQLDTQVIYAGLHFPDPRCTQQFPTPTKIDGDRRAKFAACLATLSLRPTARVDTLWGVSVLEYEPGIEIQVVFRFRKGRGYASWIGYSGRRDLRDGLPTVTPRALEAHRLAGDPSAALTPTDAAAIEIENKTFEIEFAYAWMKVCIDASGAVTGIHAREVTSPRVEAAFAQQIQQWAFRPFVIGGQAMPVCSMLRLAHPVSNAVGIQEVLPLPFPPVEGAIRVPIKQVKRIAGVTAIVPDDREKALVQKANVSTVTGAFRYCFDETGSVIGVATIEPTGIPAYDAKIHAGIRTWRYKPYVIGGVPVKACTAVAFIYTQR